ncbi:MAG: tetratricopeptide repeat protein, partial [Saprospiraceae bacterium]|nr:tetratricopeptide repeat protein [Saprospiraceae bacterium]
LLDSDPQYSELAQIGRVNQGELYQVKAQTIRGTISAETAQLSINQVATNALQIIHRLAAGKFTFPDKAPDKTHPRAWRYYVVGGVVALVGAFFIWKFTHQAKETCPQYDPKTRFKVMILPFKQTGEKKASDPAIDISDGLNVLFSKTLNLKDDAVADVNEKYDIGANYPSLTEAKAIAQGCGVQMIVWGKINETADQGYKLDIRYKLLDGMTASTGDTTLGNLLKMNDFGNLTRDVDAATRLLYIVLANWASIPIASNLLEESPPLAAKMDTAWSSELPDSTMLLAVAQGHLTKKEHDKALTIYDQILEAYPNQTTARRIRGALLYQKGDFSGAATDLEIAAPNANTADPDLLKIRVQASLKSGQPAKATEDLKAVRRKKPGDGVWIEKREQEAATSTQEIEKRLVKEEKQAAAKPGDPQLQNKAAKTNLA